MPIAPNMTFFPVPLEATRQPLPQPHWHTAADPTNLRILLIVESAAGGTGRHVLDLAEGLIRRGCDVHLIYSTGRTDRVFTDRLTSISGMRHLALKLRAPPNPGDIGACMAIRRYLRDFGPFDIIHGHSSKGGALARLAALGTSLRPFYTLHGLILVDPLMPRWRWLFYLGIELLLSWRTSRIIAVSPEEARAAIRLKLGRSRVTLIPNGVGPAQLPPRDETRAALQLAPDDIVIGFVGRMVSQKAPEILVEAFASTLAAVPRARLVMVGSGPLTNSLNQLAQRLGILTRVSFVGERDARTVLAAFDVFAMPSRKEGLPYVVLEAMAAGLPVVATASAGIESLLDDGISGRVVTTDNVAAFAAALIQLARDPSLLARMGDSARRHSQLFTIDAMVERTLQAYRQVARPNLRADERHRISSVTDRVMEVRPKS